MTAYKIPHTTMPSLTVFLLLTSVMDVHGSGDPQNPILRPPPFTDFTSIFSQTLSLIPELRTTLTNSNPVAANVCPFAVNWTQFNTQLDTGNPVPLDPVCNPSTTPRSPATMSHVSGVTDDMVSPPVVQPVLGSDQDKGRVIGLAVGITVGVLLLATVIAIIAVAVKLRTKHIKKNEILQRFVSTTSGTLLVDGASYSQPTTPGTPMTQNPMGSYSNSSTLRKGVLKLHNETCLESSTDPTLTKTKEVGFNGVEVLDEVAKPKKLEELDDETSGYENKGYEEADLEDEQEDDAGYAGSEIGWENEVNKLFEAVTADESKDAAVAETGARSRHGDATGPRGQSEPSQFMMPTVSVRSRDLFHTPAATRLSKVKFPAQTNIVMSQSTAPASPTKSTNPTKSAVSPKSSVGSSSRRTATPTSSDEDGKAGGTVSAKPGIDPRTPSVTTPPDPPPVYSTLGGPGESAVFFVLTQTPNPAESQAETPTQPPAYSEVLALASNLDSGDGGSVSASTSPSLTTTGRQPRPAPPQPRPRPTKEQASGNNISRPRPANPMAVIKPWSASAAEDDASTNASISNADTESEVSRRPVRSLLSQFEAADAKKSNAKGD